MDKIAAKEALERALELVGGPAALARKLGITSQAIGQWDHVPINRVIAVEQVTGVSRTVLRPDIFGCQSAPP
ncbi:helix-turn-helix domain-containing protein [Agrobacterium rhizogenes]|uniref:transcriptional regulator n=1 Tax=Rhizobium rhizogenes TaxID=359 RepID=UPI001571757F|nr:Cro/CI family transcriptional regulator [Rhizobium rhizogenes]NTG48996.1 helix-turn-helix domain-containing protein [Rhizobium rhizogenes]